MPRHPKQWHRDMAKRSLHTSGIGLDFQLEKGMMHHFDVGSCVSSLSDEQYHQVLNPFVDLPDGYKAGFDEDFMSKLKTFFSMGDQGCRRTGRSTLLARILLEEAIESQREIRIIDHFIDARNGGGEPEYQMYRKIQEWVDWYNRNGVHINIDFNNRRDGKHYGGFRACIIGDGMSNDRYMSLRVKGHYINMAANPFPIEDLKARKKVLEEELLLIEFDD